jgi:hypothetical protein
MAALEPDQRPVFAAAIFTGLRKGELDLLVQPADSGNTEAGTPAIPREIPASSLAGCRGLEPLASGVTGRRYNRLN